MMVKSTKDNGTLSLLDWEPPIVEKRFEDETRVRAASVSHRLSRSVSTVLLDCELSREQIAEQMSEFLGSPISEAMLNAYASEAKESHNISMERAEALLLVTGDPRIFGDFVSRHGFAVIEKRYLHAVDDAIYADQIEELKGKKRRALNGWKGGV